MFEGASAAVVTPFRDGVVDLSALRGLTRHLVEGELDGIVVVGSTGEGATLTPEERRRVLEVVLDEVAGRAFVVAGTGTNATEQTIQLSRDAQEVGPAAYDIAEDAVARFGEDAVHRAAAAQTGNAGRGAIRFATGPRYGAEANVTLRQETFVRFRRGIDGPNEFGVDVRAGPAAAFRTDG